MQRLMDRALACWNADLLELGEKVHPALVAGLFGIEKRLCEQAPFVERTLDELAKAAFIWAAPA